MPEIAENTHVLMANELVLYQRERSTVWQCRFKVDGVWQRATTKLRDLGKAKAKAKELMLEAEIWAQLGEKDRARHLLKKALWRTPDDKYTQRTHEQVDALRQQYDL